MNRFKKWLISVALVCLLLATLIGCSSAPASLGETFDPSGNPFAHRFSDVKDLRAATFIVAASDSEHKYEADYFCDGTNDHVQIQAALTAGAGGKVILLDGNYQITANLTVPASTHFAGMGKGTILTTTDADGITNMVVINGDNVTISDVKLVLGAGAGVAGTRPNIISATDKTLVWLENLWLIGDTSVEPDWEDFLQDGIYFTGVTDSKIITCRIEDVLSCPIILKNSSDRNTISGNTCISSQNWSGIALYQSNDNIVVGNTVIDCGDGIDIRADNNTISGNLCQGNASSGIKVTKNNNVVTGNACPENADYGIYLSSGRRCTISGNTCQGNGRHGIRVSGAHNNTVSGNTCPLNAQHGISVEAGAYHNAVTGNTCTANSQTADNTYDNIFLDSSDYNLISNNLCHIPDLSTTLTVGEAAGASDIRVTTATNFKVGMGVVIDLGGVNEEYHRISAITFDAPDIFTIDGVLANDQGAGETIDVPEAKYGINISTDTCDNNRVINNKLHEAGKTAKFNDAGTDTELAAYVVPFIQGTEYADSGYLIDADTDFAATWMRLPTEVQQVVRMKVYARSVAAEADKMRLEFVIYGGADNEAYTTHNGSVADHPSTSSNFAADDVIYWTVTETGVLALLGGDSVEVKVLHEAADDGDCATNAYLRTVEIEYV